MVALGQLLYTKKCFGRKFVLEQLFHTQSSLYEKWFWNKFSVLKVVFVTNFPYKYWFWDNSIKKISLFWKKISLRKIFYMKSRFGTSFW